MTNQIDPLLYRSNQDTLQVKDIERYKKMQEKQNSDSVPSSFYKMIRENIPQDVKNEIATESLSHVPSREAVEKHIAGDAQRQKLFEAAKQFETFFLEKMFKEMKKNVQEGDLFHGGYAEEIFDEMLLTERVKSINQNASFGLAETMYRQLQDM